MPKRKLINLQFMDEPNYNDDDENNEEVCVIYNKNKEETDETDETKINKEIFNNYTTCKNGDEDNNDTQYEIVKFFNIEDENRITNEKDNNQRMDLIDPNYKYHINTKSCEVHKYKDDYGINEKKFYGYCEDNLLNYSRNILKSEYGGVTLYLFVESINTNIRNKINYVSTVKKFWINSINLLNGIKLMDKNGYCHFDIKTDNIVYNELTNSARYIDFEYFCRKSEIVQKYVTPTNNDNFNAIIKPIELQFYDKINFKEMIENIKIRNKILNYFTGKIFFEKTYIEENLNKIRKQEYYKKLFDFYGSVDFKKRYMHDEDGHTKFIKESIDKYDLCCLGYSLNYVLTETRNKFTENNNENGLFYVDLQNLIDKMINPNFIERINIDDAITEYNIIMDKLNKNEYVKIQPTQIMQAPKMIKTLRNTIKNLTNKPMNRTLKKVVPIRNNSVTQENKEKITIKEIQNEVLSNKDRIIQEPTQEMTGSNNKRQKTKKRRQKINIKNKTKTLGNLSKN